MYITTQGLVLRETVYKESDKLLTVLTAEGGKRTVKAQGCRKKGSALAAASQLLTWSDMTLFEYRDYFTLREASPIEEFRGLRGDLEKLNSVDCGSAGQFTAVYDGRYTLLLPTTVEYVPTTAEDFGHFFSLLDQALPQLEQGGQNLVDFTLWESTGRIYARYAQ